MVTVFYAVQLQQTCCNRCYDLELVLVLFYLSSYRMCQCRLHVLWRHCLSIFLQNVPMSCYNVLWKQTFCKYSLDKWLLLQTLSCRYNNRVIIHLSISVCIWRHCLSIFLKCANVVCYNVLWWHCLSIFLKNVNVVLCIMKTLSIYLLTECANVVCYNVLWRHCLSIFLQNVPMSSLMYYEDIVYLSSYRMYVVCYNVLWWHCLSIFLKNVPMSSAIMYYEDIVQNVPMSSAIMYYEDIVYLSSYRMCQCRLL